MIPCLHPEAVSLSGNILHFTKEHFFPAYSKPFFPALLCIRHPLAFSAPFLILIVRMIILPWHEQSCFAHHCMMALNFSSCPQTPPCGPQRAFLTCLLFQGCSGWKACYTPAVTGSFCVERLREACWHGASIRASCPQQNRNSCREQFLASR